MSAKPLLILFVVAKICVAFAYAQCEPRWRGSGVTNGAVTALTVWDSDGSGPAAPRVVLGGSFSQAGGVPCAGVGSFDLGGERWEPLGQRGGITCFAQDQGGRLFAAAGNGVFLWDGSSWQSLGSGMNGPVQALAVQANGELLAGGAFTLAGGLPANGFARWTGSVWQSLGIGTPTVVEELLALPSGQMLGVATFTAGGVPLRHVARWSGASWTLLGNPVNGAVRALAVLPDGRYVAAGDFTAFGATAANGVAVWDGAAWQPLGAGLSSRVNALLVLPSGLLVAGGASSQGGTTPQRVSVWDGLAWQSMPQSPPDDVTDLVMLPDGRMVASGAGSPLSSPSGYAMVWTGTAWRSFLDPWPAFSINNSPVFALANTSNGGWAGAIVHSLFGTKVLWSLNGGNLLTLATSSGTQVLAAVSHPTLGPLFAGDFFVNGGSPCVAGGSGRLGTGMNGAIRALAVDNAGRVFAGGDFTMADGQPASRVAVWQGNAWQALGAGVDGSVHALAVLSNGDVIAGGSFTAAGGSPASAVARWDGSSWSPLGSGVSGGTVHALASWGSGGVVAGGSFLQAGGSPAARLARWDGNSWSPLAGGCNASVFALRATASGDLLVGGAFDTAGGVAAKYAARWNGVAFEAVGQVPSPVHAVVDASIGLVMGVNEGVGYLERRCVGDVVELAPGCNGPGGPIRTAVLPFPAAGTTLRSYTTGLAANAWAFVLFGFTDPNVSLPQVHPLGGAGCQVRSSDDAVYLLLPFRGEILATLTVPNNPALAGLRIHHQVVQFALDSQGATTGIQSGTGVRLDLPASW